MPDSYYENTPRPILHDGIKKGTTFGRIYTFAFAPMNEYLVDRERRLFLYYASCKSGFTPAAKEIARQTRIDDRRLYTVRKSLAKKGFISFDVDRGIDAAIHIRWDNIKLMAVNLRDADRKRMRDQKSNAKNGDEKSPPTKLAGITDIVRKETTLLPTIGEINNKKFGSRSTNTYGKSNRDYQPLTDAEKKNVKVFESLNVEEFHDFVSIFENQYLRQEEFLDHCDQEIEQCLPF